MRNRCPTVPVVPAFTPVPRKYRHDGWTPARQPAFIDALAETGSVKSACQRVNMTNVGAYYLRRQPGAEEFRRAWDAALDHGVRTLVYIAIDRAIEGVPVPLTWKGEVIGERRWYNDRLLMFILRHHLPARYGGAPLNPGTRHPNTVAREAQEQAQVTPKEVEEWLLEQGRALTVLLATHRDKMADHVAARLGGDEDSAAILLSQARSIEEMIDDDPCRWRTLSHMVKHGILPGDDPEPAAVQPGAADAPPEQPE